MGKSKGFKDDAATKLRKSAAARLRWQSARKHKLDLEAPTIESCINYLWTQAKDHGMDFIQFIEGYASIMFNAKKSLNI